MKAIKKISALALAVIMLLSLSISAFAAEEKGTITINTNSGTAAAQDQHYNIYRIFDLIAYEKTGDDGVETDPYYYVLNTKWAGFFTAEAGGLTYVDINETDKYEQGYVTWKDGADVKAFAAAALAYAKANSIEADTTATIAEGNTSVTTEELLLGYYLIDSSVGTLLMLDTNNPDMTITDKTKKPTDEKDSTPPSEIRVGSVIPYVITVNAEPGASNYVVHDQMSKGLDFNNDIKVYLVNGEEKTEVATTNYTVTEPVKNPDDKGDGCTFELAFEQSFLDTITNKGAETETSAKIRIEYTATINAEAVTGVDPITNKEHLDYGDNNHTESTPDHPTDDKLYEFDVVKTRSDDTVLPDADFQLLVGSVVEGSEEITKTPVKLFEITTEEAGKDPNSEHTYRAATDEEIAAGTYVDTVNAGYITFKGFGNGTYYLRETNAPNGYNELKDDTTVTITDASSKATVEGNTWKAGGVQVINYTGAELPSTGGIGTTIFYICGGVLAVGAIVLLITKKRVNSAE